MWVKHSYLSLYLAICLAVYFLQLSLIYQLFRVKGRLSNLLEATFAEVTNLITDAENL